MHGQNLCGLLADLADAECAQQTGKPSLLALFNCRHEIFCGFFTHALKLRNGLLTTNDSNVVVEEPEKAPPLTPDGNAALVDDFGGNKQLITVTTKAGNYFYILIDRANEDKKTAVHFLNQVDEADLMALMEDGNAKEEPPAVCNCTTKCEAGAVNTVCPVCVTDKSKCTGKAPEPPAETPEPEKEKPAGLNPAALILLLALLGGGGVFAYLKLVKNKPKTKGNDSLDDYDYGEEDSEE